MSGIVGVTPKGAAYSPDGRRILAGDISGNVRLWDARTGRPVTEARALDWGVSAVAFSADGHTGFVATYGGTVQAIDVDTGDFIGPPLKSEAGAWIDELRFERRAGLVVGASSIMFSAYAWSVSWLQSGQDTDLRLRAQVLATQRVNASGGLDPVPLEEWRALRERLAKEEKR